MSTVTAAVVLIVVVVVVGAGAYVAGSMLTGGRSSRVTCFPPTNPVCVTSSSAHDLRILVPFSTVQQATTVPFTALLPGGAFSNSYTFNFGDGTKPVASASPTVDHAYADPGTYIVQVSASVSGTIHDNAHALAIMTVATSGTLNVNGLLPTVSGVLVSNATSASNPTAILSPGQNATFSGSYTSAPTNPAWAALPPTLVASAGATRGAVTNSSIAARGTFSFPSSGTYLVSFVGSSLGPGGQRAYQNYTWTVYVAPGGVHGGAASASVRSSPHPGSLFAYELAPGGTYSLDPGIDYDAVGFEPIMNIYQTLIFYNSNVTGAGWQSYYPELATCVPGSPQCFKLYGQSLVQGYNYTFVVNRASRFYDPATAASWPVYPSDVLFSFARYASLADLPCASCTPDWIQAQAFLPSGNANWDGAIHWPYNNTPQAVFSSIAVNDSRWCPSAAMSQDHGCVTFHANGSGQNWGYFLELIADPFGASIMPCGWVSSTAPKSGGAGLPYWTAGNVSGAGDRPCLLPGGATSTNSTVYQNAVRGIPATGWDGFQNQCSGTATGTYCGTIQTSGVGSGPYYLRSYASGASYGLQANPAYAQNPYCTGPDCQPPAGHYAKTVNVIWETNPSVGEQAYRAGVADLATIPSTDTALLLQLNQAGDVNALSEPTLGLTFYPFILNFTPSATQSYTSNPVHVPHDFFNYLGMRQFFVHAYPYNTIESNVNTKDGIVYGFNVGGMIPQFMANYYPTNISWPSGDPCNDASSPNCAVYWWQQMQNPASPYYDPEVASVCTTANPCQFPILGWTGTADIDQRIALWESAVKTISGGRIVPSLSDVTGTNMYLATAGPPGQSAAPLYEWGWYPDYPDPSDYVVPMYFPDSTYTYGDAVGEALAVFNGTSCPRAISYYVDLAKPVSQACEGAAYWAMTQLLITADAAPLGPNRVLLYNMAEHIANQLALYVDEQQLNAVVSYSSWIRANSIDTNTILVGSFTWWTLAGNSVWYSGST